MDTYRSNIVYHASECNVNKKVLTDYTCHWEKLEVPYML
jgi:hypothetical protein